VLYAEYRWDGISQFDFSNSNFPPSTIIDSTNQLNVSVGHCCINDHDGNVFYSNRYQLYGSDFNIMQGGDSLSDFPGQIPSAGCGANNCIMLPAPGNQDSIFLLFHFSTTQALIPAVCSTPQCVSTNLLVTKFNSKDNNGTGKVLEKSRLILSDSLSGSNIFAIRHGNGRDWWLLARRAFYPEYYRILVTHDTIEVKGVQSFTGIINDCGYAFGNNISPDGLKIVSEVPNHFCGGIPSQMYVFDFDRCTGLMSNPVQFILTSPGYYMTLHCLAGSAFSSDSRYFYVSTLFFIFRFDLLATDITASKETVAFFDSTYCPATWSSPLYFGDMKLGDDGKIYVTSGGCYAHVIHYPDSSVSTCGFTYNSITLPSPLISLRRFPYHPNYALGPLTGSPCDTLLGYQQQQLEAAGVTVTPNPGSGVFTLSTDVALLHEAGTVVKVYDLTGREVLRQSITAQVSHLDLRHQSNGIYLLRVIAKRKQISLKLLKQALD
jgi:hypothetical protein